MRLKTIAATGLAAAVLTVALADDASAATRWEYAGTTSYGTRVNVYGGGDTFAWSFDTSHASTDERVYFMVTDNCGRSEGPIGGVNDFSERTGSWTMNCPVIRVDWTSTEAGGASTSGSAVW